MQSHEVLKKAFENTSPKAISSELGVSLSLVYKWAQEQSAEGSGSRNPLDRILEIVRLTGDLDILDWLCTKTGGYFVKNPISACQEGFEVLPATTEIIAQFSNLLTRISLAAQDDSITSDEAAEIRRHWDKLKCYGEGFVRCCEEGDFEQMVESDVPEPVNAPRKTLY